MKIAEKNLIIYLPVLHRGYLNFLDSIKGQVSEVYLLPKKEVKKFSKYEPDIAALDTEITKKLLQSLEYRNISVFSLKDLPRLKKGITILVNDEVSRNFSHKYLPSSKIEWQSIFLRWDRSKVMSNKEIDVEISSDPQDRYWLAEAYKNSNKSGDWWRQVGAVLIKDGLVNISSYNIGVPDDHSPYRSGGIRDYLEVGERPDLSPTIHAEQVIIAEAARRGVSLNGARIYVTHFPCSVCAKLIAYSGISKLFFGEGSANLDGERSLAMAKVEIRLVKK